MSSPPSWLTPGGLPRWLTLALVQLAGVGLIVLGFTFVAGRIPLGILTIAYGIDLVVRPAARRLPRWEALSALALDLAEKVRKPDPPTP